MCIFACVCHHIFSSHHRRRVYTHHHHVRRRHTLGLMSHRQRAGVCFLLIFMYYLYNITVNTESLNLIVDWFFSRSLFKKFKKRRRSHHSLWDIGNLNIGLDSSCDHRSDRWDFTKIQKFKKIFKKNEEEDVRNLNIGLNSCDGSSWDAEALQGLEN